MSFTGFRWWIAESHPKMDWRLRSPATDHWWKGPHLRSHIPPRGWRCWRQGDPYKCDWGRRRCRCGIYAFKSEDSMLATAWTFQPWAVREPHRGYPLWGTVGLWGRVVEHEHGFRAEHAMVQRLVLPNRIVVRSASDCFEYVEDVPAPPLLVELQRAYDVDVEVCREIEIPLQNASL